VGVLLPPETWAVKVTAVPEATFDVELPRTTRVDDGPAPPPHPDKKPNASASSAPAASSQASRRSASEHCLLLVKVVAIGAIFPAALGEKK
jgi:hypothetical protein